MSIHVKEMTGYHIKRVEFLLQAKVGLSLYILASRKILKCLLQNIYLLLDLFYHKHNPLTTTTTTTTTATTTAPTPIPTPTPTPTTTTTAVEDSKTLKTIT